MRKCGTYNLMEPLFRFSVDRIQLLFDVVRLAWVVMGMEEMLYKPSLERIKEENDKKKMIKRRKTQFTIHIEEISSNEEPKVKSKKFQKILKYIESNNKSDLNTFNTARSSII